MSGEPKPWDKRADESTEAHNRFLVYRNLGPARSVRSAYEESLRFAEKGGKRQTRVKSSKNPSGQWERDCTIFDWPERAAAWDEAGLLEAGDAVACKFVSTLDRVYVRMLETLRDAKCKPGTKTWSALIESLVVAGAFVPKDFFNRSGRTAAPIETASATANPPARSNPGV